MTTAFISWAVLGLSLLTQGSPPTFGPGSPAPPLEIKTWVKGTPVKELPKGVSVVEFWNTGCNPCRMFMPHLSELARTNPNVYFLAVDDADINDDKRVEKFVKEMGRNLDMNVAYSANYNTGMSLTWIVASGIDSNPMTYIVKDGIVMWIGHPADMDQPLKEVIAGTLDLAKSKRDHDDDVRSRQNRFPIAKRRQAALDAYNNGQHSKAREQLRGLKADFPTVWRDFDNVVTTWDALEQPDQFVSSTKAIFEGHDVDKRRMRNEVILMVTHNRKELAKQAFEAMMSTKSLTQEEYFVGLHVYDVNKDPAMRKTLAKEVLDFSATHHDALSLDRKEVIAEILKGK